MSTQSRFRLSGRAKVGIVRTLQVIMLGILLVGVALGNAGVAVNAAIGFLVTLLPAVFERRFGISMSPGLVLWITVAMALHAIGTLPLPGLDFLSPYKAVWWWDHMTHALSSSLVVGAAYAVTRAVQEHTPYINMGPKFTFVYLLVFVMAFGVFWELIEFYIGVVAGLLGSDAILTQYGLDDTVLDLFYNTLGGVLVAVFGTAYLTGLSDQLLARLDSRSTGR